MMHFQDKETPLGFGKCCKMKPEPFFNRFLSAAQGLENMSLPLSSANFRDASRLILCLGAWDISFEAPWSWRDAPPFDKGGIFA